jgi:kinesin family protein 1
VRGEENLDGWRPRGDSLIFDHQWELEKLTRLEEVGRIRHLLSLRERLGLDMTPNPTTKTEKDVCNLAARANQSPVHNMVIPSPQTPTMDNIVGMNREYTQNEIDLMKKCIKLVKGRIGMSKDNSKEKVNELATTPVGDELSELTSSTNTFASDLVSPQGYIDNSNGWEPPVPIIQQEIPLPFYVPELEEIRISPVIARKGYLNILEHGCAGWKKRWVVVRRPYVFIYRTDKDFMERAIINLSTAQVECSEDQAAMVKQPNTFR